MVGSVKETHTLTHTLIYTQSHTLPHIHMGFNPTFEDYLHLRVERAKEIESRVWI